jgi:hypothetical protein
MNTGCAAPKALLSAAAARRDAAAAERHPRASPPRPGDRKHNRLRHHYRRARQRLVQTAKPSTNVLPGRGFVLRDRDTRGDAVRAEEQSVTASPRRATVQVNLSLGIDHPIDVEEGRAGWDARRLSHVDSSRR